MRSRRTMISVTLLAALAGCGTSPGGAPGPTPGSGGIGRPQPRPAVTLTLADGGRTVRLRVGQAVRVRLAAGGWGRWRQPVNSGPALHRTYAAGGYPGSQPAVAVFRAVRPGRATVHSVTDFACLHAHPRCMVAQRVWAVPVAVTGAP